MSKLKNITFKKVIKTLGIIYGMLSLALWIYVVDSLISINDLKDNEYVLLNDSWEVSINDNIYEEVSLDAFTFNSVNKGDEITMKNKLPDEWNLIEGVLRLHISKAAASIYIEDELVYEYGYDRMAKNKTVGSGYQFIDFPGEYQGKAIEIRMSVAEDQAFSSLETVRIYEWKNVYKVLMTENRYPMFLGCFLFIFGIVTCFITICALTFSGKYVRMLCISIFSSCIGLWTLCYYDVLLIFSIPLYSISLLEYISLYLAPIPLLVYVKEDVRNVKYEFLKKLYWVILTVQVAATVIALYLHAFDIVHCSATLKYMQLLIVVDLLYFLVVDTLNLKIKEGTDKLFIIGMLLVVACISYDLIGYCLNRYLGINIVKIKGMTSIGVVIFVFVLIGSFYIKLTQSLMQEAERNSLIKRAYTDELTQIHNRRYCTEYMEAIREKKSYDYTIICFDLNNLKTVNDTYGHARGDILIKSAADVIAATFEGHGVVGRMGGDEFIAILNTSAQDEIDGLIENFQSNMNRKNQEIENLNMSIAYGYATCNGSQYDIEKMYQIADNRMYEHKKKMKSVEAV